MKSRLEVNNYAGRAGKLKNLSFNRPLHLYGEDHAISFDDWKELNFFDGFCFFGRLNRALGRELGFHFAIKGGHDPVGMRIILNQEKGRTLELRKIDDDSIIPFGIGRNANVGDRGI